MWRALLGNRPASLLFMVNLSRQLIWGESGLPSESLSKHHAGESKQWRLTPVHKHVPFNICVQGNLNAAS